MLHRKIGRFYVAGRIGSGGMATVYLAVNPRSREKRALKILAKRASAPASSYARFLREIDIVRRLDHPRIIRILDAGSFDDCYYYMMDYMPGGSLRDLLGARRLSVHESAAMLAGICDGVAHAHSRGIIHRDLKPANVLLDGRGEPVVSDFGIGKALQTGGAGLTESHEVMGTPAYLAPEQRRSSKSVDARADVFALGAILYECIMGFPPMGRFPWPHEVHADVPGRLQEVLERCLALDPARRFADGGELASEVGAFLAVAPYEAVLSEGFSRPSEADQTTRSETGDRLADWIRRLCRGTSGERMATAKAMAESMSDAEILRALDRYPDEVERVRWGLIRVFSRRKVTQAVPLMVADLSAAPLHEAAVEALGTLGAPEAFEPLLAWLRKRPESALTILLPLARTGRERALEHIVPYLNHEMAVLRQAAARALEHIRGQSP